MVKIEGVLIDMDGTLFDSERLYYDIWKMAEATFGFTGSEEMMAKISGSQPADPLALYTSFFDGDAVLGKQVMEYRSRKSDEMRFEKPVPLKEGARELLGYLHQNKIPAALATSSTRGWADYLFNEADMPLLFDAVVTKESITKTKPDPQIFLLAARQLGVPIARCMVVEDSINGVLSGHAAGAYTVLVPDITPVDAGTQSLADAIVPTLHDVVALLETMRD